MLQAHAMSSALNLLREPWLPIRRASGIRTSIRISEVVDGLSDDPVVELDWPRPDFQIATLEFLIGVLATACPAPDQRRWRRAWNTPLSKSDLEEALQHLAHAFDLDGPGPRFLQDLEDLIGEGEPIERLLIEAPGASTVAKNTDLLIKREQVSCLGRPAAAIALYTLQSWAPAGGAGNRTGLRGGGPMVTLVRPGNAPSLWHMLWANTPTGERPQAADLPKIFPWLAPTLTSEGSRTVVPHENAHPLQVFWGMPRRIRLDFEASPPEGARCAITGRTDDVMVRRWRQRPRGANYAQWGRVHPITPHYQPKAGGEYLPLHPQPGGVGYRHWLGLVLERDGGQTLPARAIADWRQTRWRDVGAGSQSRLLVAGFDMDNMKARSFVESEMPLPGGMPEQQGRLDRLAQDLVQAADRVASLLRLAVRNALFSPGATVKPDAEVLSTARERLWERTEAEFFAALTATLAHQDIEMGQEPERPRWMECLRRTAFAIFDEVAPLSPSAGPTAAARLAAARRGLRFTITGHGKEGRLLFAGLGLPTPDASKTPKAAA